MKQAVLLILDGWGFRKNQNMNAIAKAKTPHIDSIWKGNSHTFLSASGKEAGLPRGVMGNSEVGHMTIGAGRIIDTDFVRINKAIKDGSFFANKVLLSAVKTKNKLHLVGLLSDGGVHSHIKHLYALMKMAKKTHDTVYVHAITDGRDTGVKDGVNFLRQLKKEAKKMNIECKIATLMGRFYAMDRDNRWHREHKAYDAMVNRKGEKYTDAIKAIKDHYKKGITDEFIPPTIIDDGKVEEGDSVVFFNFRSDRARELTRAFVEGKFEGFKRKKIIDLNFVCLTQYDSKIDAPVAFKPVKVKNCIGEVLSKNGARQFRVSETEKYAHVTYFLNCGREKPFKGEKRKLISSDKIRTYDERPEMQAHKITESLMKQIGKKDFLVANIANGDMVGHTGNFDAAVRACETVDKCVGKIVKKVKEKDYVCVITADHGNCEEMRGEQGTTHTTNKVPLIVVGEKVKLRAGGLKNIAPTLLKLMKIKRPASMCRPLF